jgi:ribosomal protein S18 acetylase RimI-like enzyme
VGFCLSTTIEKPNKPWRYGYIIWKGVSTTKQSKGIGTRLLNETIRRMKKRKVKFMFIDTEESNSGAIKFFEKMGFEKRHRQVWMWKNL